MSLRAEAFDAAPVAMGVADAQGRLLRTNAALGALLGYAGHELAGRSVLELVAVADRPRVVEGLQASHSAAELLLLHRDGHALRVQVTTRVLTSRSGAAQVVVAVVGVVEPGGRSRERERLGDLFDVLPTPVALVTASGHVVEANAAFRARLGLPSSSPPADPGRDEAADRWGWTRFQLPTGEEVPCETRRVPGPNGEPLFLVQLVDPATPLATDSLTGLATRELLLERLTHALTRAVRSGNVVELVVVDLDDFKSINDTLGHVVGDEVLSEVAERIARSIRPADTAARWGGDEFVVLLEDPSETGALTLCSRLTAILAEPVAVRDGLTVDTAASCGWVRAQPQDDAVSLLHRADLEMYEQKRRRRRGRSTSADEWRDRLGRARARSSSLRQLLTTTKSDLQVTLDAARGAVTPPPESPV